MRRIICIGNRFVREDSGGFQVFERLSRDALPAQTELVDGGLGGLDLLRLVEGTERIVFVDSVSGFAPQGRASRLEVDAVAALAEVAHSHGAGLPYLLRVLPAVCDGPLPEITVVGLEAGSGEEGVEEAASLALAAITGGPRPTARPGLGGRC